MARNNSPGTESDSHRVHPRRPASSVSVLLVVTPSASESQVPPIPSDRAIAVVRAGEGALVSDESAGTARVRVDQQGDAPRLGINP